MRLCCEVMLENIRPVTVFILKIEMENSKSAPKTISLKAHLNVSK